MTVNLIGKTFGRVTVISISHHRQGASICWNVSCKCGKKRVISSRDLTSYKRKGCGACEDSKHPLYGTWAGIKSRCLDVNSSAYKDYGARGISICDRWKEDFLDFVADVGEKPAWYYTLDRINNDGNYEPGNCRWATATEQACNKRDAKQRLLSKEDIIAIYISKESVASLSIKHSIAEKTVRNIRARSYSAKATNICLDYILSNS